MERNWDKISSEKSDKLQELSYQIATELFEEGFSEEVVYTFLHKTVGIGLYEAEVEMIL